MESKKGSLTIEASIGLTAFMFIVVTILSFATVYRAQSMVSHATLQTSQSLAVESYYRETISKSGSSELASNLVKFASFLGYDVDRWDDGYASFGDKGTDFYRFVRERFACSIAGDIEAADKILKDAGIPEGLDGIDFSYSSVNNSEVIINARYEVKLPFSFFGEQTISLSKSAKTKAFNKIADNNGYVESQPETDFDKIPGSSGGGSR